MTRSRWTAGRPSTSSPRASTRPTPQPARPPATTAWTSPVGPRPSDRHLIAGVIDELTLDIAPVLLGSGERIFDGVESFSFEPVEVLHSPLTTHIRYRRVS